MLEGSGMLAANIRAETRSDSGGKEQPPPTSPCPITATGFARAKDGAEVPGIHQPQACR